MDTIYDSIELSEQEIKEALYEAKKKKWFHERSKAYWEAQEKTRSGKPLIVSQVQTLPVKDQSIPVAPPRNE